MEEVKFMKYERATYWAYDVVVGCIDIAHIWEPERVTIYELGLRTGNKKERLPFLQLLGEPI